MIARSLHDFYRRHLFGTDWNIGIVRTSPTDLASLVAEGKLGRVRWCPDLSPFRFRADPFIWRLEGDARIIYEEMDHFRRRAHIRSRPLQRFGGLRVSRPEIMQPFHLSYPFTFQSGGRWLCIPESARAAGLDLYEWEPAANAWRLRCRLLDQVGVLDATLLRRQNIWYLFGTIRGDGQYDKLRIWWADRLEGPWHAHRTNPAKADIRSARPAGPIFELAGCWYRPAQDCTRGYGSAVTINRIDLLTPEEFSETTVSRVAPDPNGPYPDGLHTLAVSDDVIMVDGKREGFTPSLPFVKLVRRLARWAGHT